MAEGGFDLEALQQQLVDLQTQLDQQRVAQAAAANAAATNAVNAVESCSSLLSGPSPHRIGLR